MIAKAPETSLSPEIEALCRNWLTYRTGVRLVQIPLMPEDFAARYRIEKPVWMARIARAEDGAQVMDVVREFVRSHEALWATLPTDCQPPPFTSSDDVSRYAFALYQKELRYEGSTGLSVLSLASFFSEAAHRMALVMAAQSHVTLRPFFDRQS